jgi:hypothetical protein
LINIHSADDDYGGDLDKRTVRFISKSLEYQIQTAGQKANYQSSLLISSNKVLDSEMVADILKTGFSQVFVYNDDHGNKLEIDQIVGVFDTKVSCIYKCID